MHFLKWYTVNLYSLLERFLIQEKGTVREVLVSVVFFRKTSILRYVMKVSMVQKCFTRFFLSCLMIFLPGESFECLSISFDVL